MIEFENKEDRFEYERIFCLKKPEIWKVEANNLFASAQVLYEFAHIHDGTDPDKEKSLYNLFSIDIAGRVFWYYRIIRMLWGFGFEDILKGIYLKKIKHELPHINNDTFQKIKTHNLLDLFNRAGITLNNDQSFYIRIIQKCAIWMGRYPLPVKSADMYEQLKPMGSPAELLQRSRLRFELYSKGITERFETESDVLRSGIGDKEFRVVQDLKSITYGVFDDL